MKKYSLILFLFLSLCFYGQNIDLPKIVPPSPTAYELGKYGQVPVGMFTGTPSVSVPLYTYSTRNLSVPISLSYNSNGIKVDQLSSNVGLGWSLNAGGVITRIVRDKPDEQRGVLTPDGLIQELGYRSPEAMDFFYAAGEDGADSETDLYMYNFMGHSGKFVFENLQVEGVGIERGIVMLPQTNVKVQVLSGGFKVTTDDGIIYTFLEQEQTASRTSGGGPSTPEVSAVTSWYLTKMEHPKGDIINFEYSASNSVNYVIGSSDALTVLIPYFQDGCSQYYAGSQDVDHLNTNFRIESPKRITKISSNVADFGEILFESNVSHPEIISHKLISKITVKDNSPTPVTRAQFDFGYDSTVNDRILLDEIQFLDPEMNYSFEYYNPDQIPPRLANSADYYGYFNGKTNLGKNRYPNPNDPLVKSFIYPHFLYYSLSDLGADKTVDPTSAINGLLKKVHYPTKGFNELEYEANSYSEMVTVYPNESDITLPLSVLTDEGDQPHIVEDIGQTGEIMFDQLVKFEMKIGLPYNSNYCNNNLPSHPLQAKLTITDDLNVDIPIMRKIVTGYVGIGNVLFQHGYPSPDNFYYVEFKKGRTYTIKLESRWMCSEISTDIVYRSSDQPYDALQNIITGGMRLKSVKSFDTPASISPNNIMRYYYGKRDAINVSSGQKGPRPYYITKSINREIAGCAAGEKRDITYQSLTSNSVRQLYNSSDAGSINYKYVTVSYGGDNFEGGGIENEYYIMPDTQGKSLHGDNIDGSPWVNTGWGNGLLKRETIFKKNESDFSPLRETTNSFVTDSRRYKEVFGYSVVKKFNIGSGYRDITYDCTYEDTQRRIKYWYCAANHKHDYSQMTNGEIGNYCHAQGNIIAFKWIEHPCYDEPLPLTIIRPELIENLDIMEYTNNSYWFYLGSSIVKEYDESGNPKAVTTTQYHYENPEHLQPTRVVSTRTGDNNISITTTEYAQDLGLTELIDEYRIAEPICVRTYRDKGSGEELLSTQKTVYDDFGGPYLPKAVQTAKGGDPLQNRFVYSAYDAHGNPTEVYKPNGPRTSYIWGYHGLYPVAKIENATYAQATDPGLNLDFGKINDPASAQEIQDEIAKIRTGLPNAQVTTYTYKELTGINSVIDPRGYKTTYYYDTFGRLQYVKDADGNVLSENQYHYIND